MEPSPKTTELMELEPGSKFILFPDPFISGRRPRDEHEVFMNIKWTPDVLPWGKPGCDRSANAISLKTGKFASFHPLEKVLKLTI